MLLLPTATLFLLLQTPVVLASPGTDEPGALGEQDAQAHQQDQAYYYAFDRRGQTDSNYNEFRRKVRATLADRRGWGRADIALVNDADRADLTIILASPQQVDQAHEVCSPKYSCRVGDEIYINDDRWRNGARPWGRALDYYRSYVVNHEVGHWLRLDHYDCPSRGARAPVVQQQSIDMEGCRENWWPLQFEIDDLASIHGTRPRYRMHDRPGVVRNGRWYVRYDLSSGPASLGFGYGRSADVPVAGDWNDDGFKTPGVFRDGRWHLRLSATGGAADVSFTYGRAGDIPVVGDWNGDGRETPGVVRGRTWHLRNSLRSGSGDISFSYGRRQDTPVAGDWNGNGVSTPGVVRDARWHLRNSLSAGGADRSFGYGSSGDEPVVGDWNNSGQDGVGVVRGKRWLLRDTPSAGPGNRAFSYGRSSDVPIVWR